MTDAVIVATARTGLAKSWRGALNMTHPVTFTGHVLQHAMQRARLDPKEVEDVIVGGIFMERPAGLNGGRQVALRRRRPHRESLLLPRSTNHRARGKTDHRRRGRDLRGRRPGIDFLHPEPGQYSHAERALAGAAQARNLLEYAADCG